MRTNRPPDWTGFLTPKEYSEFLTLRDLVKDSKQRLLRLEMVAKGRRSEAQRSIKEAAE